ncbi:hypothetical protein ACFSM7_05940 [Clavibacter michiganensis subsp. tessellarius]|nr:hypothetical protein [Clavibacter michiganensis]
MHRTAREPAPDSHSPGARTTPGTPRTLRAALLATSRSSGARPSGTRS